MKNALLDLGKRFIKSSLHDGESCGEGSWNVRLAAAVEKEQLYG